MKYTEWKRYESSCSRCKLNKKNIKQINKDEKNELMRGLWRITNHLDVNAKECKPTIVKISTDINEVVDKRAIELKSFAQIYSQIFFPDLLIYLINS